MAVKMEPAVAVWENENRTVDAVFRDGQFLRDVKKYEAGLYPHPQPKMNNAEAKIYWEGREGRTKDGFPMKLVEYRKASDITVSIDVGHMSVEKRATLCAFKRGSIKAPVSEAFSKIVTKSGETAEFISFSEEGKSQMYVYFPSTCTVAKVWTQAYKTGSISNPVLKTSGRRRKTQQARPQHKRRTGNGVNLELKAKREGMISIATNGQVMKILSYNGYDDVTVAFQDGFVKEHVSFKRFRSGNVLNPSSPSHYWEKRATARA